MLTTPDKEQYEAFSDYQHTRNLYFYATGNGRASRESGWNFDVKNIYLDADSKWNNGAIVANIGLNPWIVGTGVSYRF